MIPIWSPKPLRMLEKENKMNLDQTWEECLKMWKWVSEAQDGKMLMATLKLKYLDDHKMESIVASCFFCDYADSCRSCPGRLVDAEFDCKNLEYSYLCKPKEFYQELLRLNAIRLERKTKNE